jgi:hypothetical protein
MEKEEKKEGQRIRIWQGDRQIVRVMELRQDQKSMVLPFLQDYFFFVFLISWDVHLLCSNNREGRRYEMTERE